VEAGSGSAHGPHTRGPRGSHGRSRDYRPKLTALLHRGQKICRAQGGRRGRASGRTNSHIRRL
jgi:hypothetical protein